MWKMSIKVIPVIIAAARDLLGSNRRTGTGIIGIKHLEPKMEALSVRGGY